MAGNIVITGGAGGIGSKIVEKFVNNGFVAYVVDVDEEACKNLVEKFGENKVKTFLVDVTDAEALERLEKDLPKIDHVVTLAGRALEGEWNGFLKTDASVVRKSVELNLLGHLNAVHAFYKKIWKHKNAAITLVSSINAFGGYGLPVYSAAKAGLVGFAASCAEEFGKDGIRINAVLPGTVVTPATQKEPKDFDKLKKGIALANFADTSDIANAVYALSETLTAVTGQKIVVDAGQTKMH